MRARWAVAALVMLSTAAGEASATLGGPLTVEVLGWDKSTERIYVRQVGRDESGERDCIFYFALRSEKRGTPQVVPVSRDRYVAPSDTAILRLRRNSLERTLAHLQPLVRDDEGSESFIRGASVLHDSTVSFGTWSGRVRQFVVDVTRWEWPPVGDSILVTTYIDPAVHVLRRYKIPGHDGHLVVFSYLGDPDEGGYEVQGCALVGLRGTGLQRLDSREGVLPWPSPR